MNVKGEDSNDDAYDSDIMDLDGELSTSSDSIDGDVSPLSTEAEDAIAQIFPSKQKVDKPVEEPTVEQPIEEQEDACDSDEIDSDADCLSHEPEQSISEKPIKEPEPAESSWKILGEHRFVEKKILSSAPIWAENPTTFKVKIKSRIGDGIDHLEGLDERLFEHLSKEISVWFPVQRSVLPKLLTPDDVLHDIAISAPTGSGKTLCYLIPIFNQVLCGWKSKYVMSVVLAPTKTLIRQIANEFNRFNFMDARIVVFGNGESYAKERETLFPNGSTKARAHIIISTPQRLVEHLIDRNGTINLKKLRYLVVDEADSMKFVREEWLGILERMSNYPPNHNQALNNDEYNNNLQKILVSATLSLEADKLHDWNLRSPCLYRATIKKVEEKSSNQDASKPISNLPTNDVARLTLPTGLSHEIKICEKQFKPLLIYCYLARNSDWRKVMIFVNSIEVSRRLTLLLTYLFEEQRRVSELSSNLSGKRRLKELKRIKNSENCVVICSDTVGRGIDIPDIDVVFNYDVPMDAKNFVHRAGRAARAGRSGHVVTLATKEEKLGFKRKLIAVDVWESAVENREKEADFVQRFREKYMQALRALKTKLEDKPLKKRFLAKKNKLKTRK